MKIWVYRCSVCNGMAASTNKKSVVKDKNEHFDLTGHLGRMKKEDRSVVELG